MKPRSFLIFLLLAVCWVAVPASASRLGDLRIHARFITDRMAYELDLSNRQYNDVFEINYDFFYNVEPYVDRMAYGDPYAVDMYYRYLDERNDDLRWVLSRRKYVRFMRLEHFYLPIYVVNRVCHVRIYNIYPNRSYFYYGRPTHYYSYRGGHCRHHCGGISFYKTNYRNHYHHDIYSGHYQSIRSNTRHRDFPKLNHALPSRHDSYRESNRVSHSMGIGSNVSTNRPNRTDRVTRPNSTTTRPSTSRRPGTTVTRPSSSSRPSTSRHSDREYRRPESNYIRSAGFSNMHREPSKVHSTRSDRKYYQPSSTRSTRTERVGSRPSRSSSIERGNSHSRSRSERGASRDR